MEKLRVEIEHGGQWDGKPSVYECGYGIRALCYDKQTANLIVEAVNSHAKMKGAIEFALQIIKSTDPDDAEAMPEVVSHLEEALESE